MTARIRLHRNRVRLAADEYALSASTRSGLHRGGPPANRGPTIASSTAGIIGESPACPALSSTQQFSKAWIKKLAKDAELHRAQTAILVSEALPRDIDGSGWVDGILVCDFAAAVHLAAPFRMLVATNKKHVLANALTTERERQGLRLHHHRRIRSVLGKYRQVDQDRYARNGQAARLLEPVPDNLGEIPARHHRWHLHPRW